MRMMPFACVGSVLALAACASVPTDAPEELHSAKAAIDAANDADADDFVPKTMAAAEDKLESAVDLFDDSKDADGAGKLDASKTEANAARSMAENASALTADLKSWDGGDLSAFLSMKNAESDLAASRGEIDRLRNNTAAIPQTSGELDFTISQPVVFFPTAQAEIETDMAPALAALVDSLKANDQLFVTLVGHADARGEPESNLTLSQSRAERVSRYLQDQGIAAERIQIQADGEENAMAQPNDPERLQLDRRVDASVTTTAH